MATLHVRMTDGTTDNFEDAFGESRGWRFCFEVDEVDRLTVVKRWFAKEFDAGDWRFSHAEDVASYGSAQWDTVRELEKGDEGGA